MENKITADKTGTACNNYIHSKTSLIQCVYVFAVNNILKILTVLILLKDLINLKNIFFGNPTVKVGYLFQAGNLAVLVSFNSFDKIVSLNQAFVSTCVKPGITLTQNLNVKLILLKINTVKVGNLKLTAFTGLKILCVVNYAVIVKIKTCYTVI